jgi:hypothetical protein
VTEPETFHCLRNALLIATADHFKWRGFEENSRQDEYWGFTKTSKAILEGRAGEFNKETEGCLSAFGDRMRLPLDVKDWLKVLIFRESLFLSPWLERDQLLRYARACAQLDRNLYQRLWEDALLHDRYCYQIRDPEERDRLWFLNQSISIGIGRSHQFVGMRSPTSELPCPVCFRDECDGPLSHPEQTIIKDSLPDFDQCSLTLLIKCDLGSRRSLDREGFLYGTGTAAGEGMSLLGGGEEDEG